MHVLSAPVTSRKRADAIQFRFIYLATFPVFLVAALVNRIAPFRARSGAAIRSSIFGEAKAAAKTCGSFAFMG